MVVNADHSSVLSSPITTENTQLFNPLENALSEFIENCSYETTPGAATKIPDYRLILPPGTTVYVTLLPKSTIDDTISICARLASEGFVPVPHYAARQIPNRAKLSSSLQRFREEVGGTQILALAGSSPNPVGDFDNSMQLLETGLFDKFGIERIGVAGHPEGSPDISADGIKSALLWKNRFSDRTDAKMHIVTQFCFEARPVIEWEKQLMQWGNTLPIHIGVPGIATVKTLIRHATACGVGASMMFLKKKARKTAKLFSNSTPENLLIELTNHRMKNPDTLIHSVHVYPLGGLRKSAEWFAQLQSGTPQKTVSAA